MKRLMLVLVIVALAVPLAAQEKTEVFAFFDNPGFRYSSVDGSHASGGYGASLRYFMTPRFSAELSIARHDRDVVVYDVANPAAPVLLADYRVKAVPGSSRRQNAAISFAASRTSEIWTVSTGECM